MKKLCLALTIIATASAGFFALNIATAHARQQLQFEQRAQDSLTGRLSQMQEEQTSLATRVHELQRARQNRASTSRMAPGLVTLLLKSNLKSASPEMQDKVMTALGRGTISSTAHTLVSKATLKATILEPLKRFPDNGKLTDSASGVLALTPGEQQSVESAFAEAFEGIGAWAKAHVQREGPTNKMLVRYTIPIDQAFERESTGKLFGTINAALGQERGELMSNYFDFWRIDEDGAIGDRANILEIYHTSEPSVLAQRSGWRWLNNSEAINTEPEPIKLDRFPAAFFFVFPGGWQEVAQREGFELPKESQP